MRRFALIASANDGGTGRARLRFADSDAVAVSEVLQSLGGLRVEDLKLVPGARRASLQAAFDGIRDAVTAAGPGPQRRELFVYYSGHSDEEGLLLGGERVSLRRAARLDRGGGGRRAHRRARLLRLGRPHPPQGRHPPPALPERSVDRRPRPRLPDRQLGERGGAGVGPGGRGLLHPLPGLGPARRRRHHPRRAGHPQRGLPLRLPRDLAAHRAHGGRRAAPGLRHPAGRHRRPCR